MPLSVIVPRGVDGLSLFEDQFNFQFRRFKALFMRRYEVRVDHISMYKKYYSISTVYSIIPNLFTGLAAIDDAENNRLSALISQRSISHFQ